jgi:hypothetical protein
MSATSLDSLAALQAEILDMIAVAVAAVAHVKNRGTL